MSIFLSKESSISVLQKIISSSYIYRYELEKHRIVVLDDTGNELIYLRLPIDIPPAFNENFEKQNQVNYVILLIQSGNCAMGFFKEGQNWDHKVFRSYMVRKKQGTSQVKYLKTKGKSRAGSRVRLGETVEFFENINERLQNYFEEHDIHRIAMSCSKILIPYLFNSKIQTPFTKQDERIFKIPKHVHTPIYDVMMDVNKFLLKGELIYNEAHQKIADDLLNVK
ncbi:MAG: hypothetical protein M3512_05565 [Bacteroidota bacterium]|nr:hypothetical protein [Bacteroidota bacterium]